MKRFHKWLMMMAILICLIAVAVYFDNALISMFLGVVFGATLRELKI